MVLRRRARPPGLPTAWRDVLAARSAHWPLLGGAERDRLGELADWLLTTKRWEAARGLDLGDEVRTLVAAHAALPILALDEEWYDRVGTIVVRDGSMTQRHSAGPVQGTIDRTAHVVDGESHHGDGPVMVSWRAARREAANLRLGRDVVLHEFAHKLDMHDGTIDGTPAHADETKRQRWIDVCTDHYEAVEAGEPGAFLRSYAGTNVGEFFAVATETFFTRPADLAERKPDLYGVFADFYRQDPAERVRRAVASSPGESPAVPMRIVTRRPTR